MLTRLKVSGFKNLHNVDVRFGPFTCVAGANGVGKSNLFDAIRFFSSLADKTFMEAALSVRDDGGRSSDIRGIFLHSGRSHAPTIELEAEMIVPQKGFDDLGQSADASITFLRYSVKLRRRDGGQHGNLGPIELIHEDLDRIPIGEARENLKFGPSKEWLNSVVLGRRASKFISTEEFEDSLRVNLHQDFRQGRKREFRADSLPRTVISSVTAAEYPTALLAVREMQSWRFLQLEPHALRCPDEYKATARLGADGSHLPATLNRLAKTAQSNGGEKKVYAQVANRLAELIGGIREIRIDRDDKRELLTLLATEANGTTHAARALSDGTLRFLALAVLELDPEATGTLCLEEPENGIHPQRIPAILKLLKDIAMDVDEPMGADNPLRQVIVNTHSPAVVAEIDEQDLLYAEPSSAREKAGEFQSVNFRCLQGTWREEAGTPTIAKGNLVPYIVPFLPPRKETLAPKTEKTRRVIDRNDIQQLRFTFD